jgi:hypothetical protein
MGPSWLLAQHWLHLRDVGGTQGEQHTINSGRGAGDREAGGVVEVGGPVFCLDGEEQHTTDLAGIGADRLVRADVGQRVLIGENLDAAVGGQWLEGALRLGVHQDLPPGAGPGALARRRGTCVAVTDIH